MNKIIHVRYEPVTSMRGSHTPRKPPQVQQFVTQAYDLTGMAYRKM
ncbi:MAG: hypothetical protein ACOYLM_09900 [Methylococcaceae bacterium]